MASVSADSAPIRWVPEPKEPSNGSPFTTGAWSSRRSSTDHAAPPSVERSVTRSPQRSQRRMGTGFACR
jgi:hypothetical protein